MKLAKGIFGGAGIGFGVGAVVCIFVLFLPLFGCACDLVSCFFKCNPSLIFSGSSSACQRSTESFQRSFNYVATFIFTTALGTIIGTIWGAAKTVQVVNEKNRILSEQREQERKVRCAQNRKELDSDVAKIKSRCNSIRDLAENSVSNITYNSVEKQKEINSIIDECVDICDKTENQMKALLEKYTDGQEEEKCK